MPDNTYNLIDLFDSCIERMAAGERIDSILADYPEASDDLRSLLETGQLVYQAQLTELEINSSELDSAKASTRQRLEVRLQKPKNNLIVMDKPKRRRRTWWMSAVAGVAMLIVGVGIGIGVMNLGSARMPLANATQVAQQNSFGLTATELIDLLTATPIPLTGTLNPLQQTIVSENATQNAQVVSVATGTSVSDMTATQVVQIVQNVTATADIDFAATRAANEIQQTTVAQPVQQTQAANQANNVEPTLIRETQVAFATQRAGSVGTMTPTLLSTDDPTATPTPAPSMTAPPTATVDSTAFWLTVTSVASRTPDANAFPTSTPIGTSTPLLTRTARPTMTPTEIEFGCPNGNCGGDIASTSVASMDATPQSTTNLTSDVRLTATAMSNLVAVPTSVAALATGVPSATPSPAIALNYSGVELDPLRAGEIDDNAEWDRYMEYRRNYLSQFGDTVIDLDVRNRRIIQVLDNNDLPVPGALVRITANDRTISETRTYATGMTQFFPKLDAASQGVDVFNVSVEYENYRAFADLDLERPGDILTVRLDFAQLIPTAELDVLFLMDATGSMGDEIAQLQNNITVIAGEIDALPGNLDVQYGLVTYRDYPVPGETISAYPFTADVAQFQTALNQVYADGTDNPDWDEALNEAMFTTLTEMQWRDDAVKLVFLVADARPHLNHPQETHIYTEEALRAANLGIKIHPIASSGLEPAGEYIFRQIAQITMGHFVFLTYDNNQIAINSGAPGDTRTDLEVGEPEDAQGVGDYDVTQLDELVLRLITDELAALTTPVVADRRITPAPPVRTPDPFALTATKLVAGATQTAIAQMQLTSDPPNMGINRFEMTATALIAGATQTVEAALTESETITQDDLADATRSVFITGLILGGAVIGALALVWFIIYRYRRRHRKRG